MAWTVPVPVSGTVCGLPEALSVIVMFPVSAPSALGVKVTEMTHVLAAARVLPQGLLLVFKAKSPLGTMLLMFSVAVPVFLRVTFLAALVASTITLPNAKDAGVSVMVGVPVLAFTVRLSVVVLVNEPDTPLIVTVTVPVAAVAEAAKVSVLVEAVEVGLKVAVTPVGRPEAVRLTLPVKPFTSVTVMVLVPLAPWATETVFGEAERVKLAVAPACTVTEAVPSEAASLAPSPLKHAVMVCAPAPVPPIWLPVCTKEAMALQLVVQAVAGTKAEVPSRLPPPLQFPPLVVL